MSIRFLSSLTFLALLLPAAAEAVEIKNFRPCFAPVYLGTERKSEKMLPGDVLFATYDIDGLTVDPKTGKASFLTVVEVFDANAEAMSPPKQTPIEVTFHLGGMRIPGDLHVQMGRNQKPGKYRIRLTAKDRVSGDQKSYIHNFELLPKTFGIGAVVAPSIGFPGLSYAAEFALFDLTLDANKKANAEVTMRVLDEAGKVVATPVVSTLPNDLAADADLEKENFVPIRYPIFLNRPGRFTVDIVAKDHNGKKEARLSYPLHVLDIAAGK